MQRRKNGGYITVNVVIRETFTNMSESIYLWNQCHLHTRQDNYVDNHPWIYHNKNGEKIRLKRKSPKQPNKWRYTKYNGRDHMPHFITIARTNKTKATGKCICYKIK
jgi:hypothetical protein